MADLNIINKWTRGTWRAIRYLLALEALEFPGGNNVACWLVLAERSIQARLATEQ